MATETLNVRLMMQAQQYKREARGAASATGAIAGSAKTAGTETSRLDRQLGATGLTMRHAVAGGAVVAGAAVVEFAKDSVRASSDLQESINAVNVVFGDVSDGIHAIGEESADSFGLAQSAFNQFAVRFSAFAKNIAQEEGREIVDVVGEMTGRIADFASVHNLSLEEAATVAQSTLAGETEVFRRFGGDVSAAAVKSKGLELGLSGVNDELTEGEKQLVRYRLFMEQTDDTAGDFKNTQDDLANATRTLDANMEDFKARLGTSLTPVLAEAASSGIQLLDILDPDVDLGWTQRLSAGIQLITGEGSEAVKTYIEQKTALFALSEEAEAALAVTEESIGASNRHRGAIEGLTGATEGYGSATGEVVPSVEALAFETERAGRAAKFQRDELLKTRNELRNIHDPLFRMVSLNSDLAEAEEAVEEASKKGVASPEYRDAVIDRAGVIADLEDTLIELKNKGIDPTGAAAELMLADLDIPPEVMDFIFAQFDALQADFEGRTFRAQFSFPTVDFGESGVGFQTGNRIFRQHGGPVTARQPYVVGEAGPELFIPDHSGTIVPNSQMTSTGTAVAGGQQTVNVFTLTWGDFVRKAADAGLEIQRYGW